MEQPRWLHQPTRVITEVWVRPHDSCRGVGTPRDGYREGFGNPNWEVSATEKAGKAFPEASPESHLGTRLSQGPEST